MITFIILLVLTLTVTGVAIGMASYAAHITNMISGNKLLYISVEKGYKYATTYRNWQMSGNIAVAIAIVAWVLFIIYCIVKIKKKRKS